MEDTTALVGLLDPSPHWCAPYSIHCRQQRYYGSICTTGKARNTATRPSRFPEPYLYSRSQTGKHEQQDDLNSQSGTAVRPVPADVTCTAEQKGLFSMMGKTATSPLAVLWDLLNEAGQSVLLIKGLSGVCFQGLPSFEKLTQRFQGTQVYIKVFSDGSCTSWEGLPPTLDSYFQPLYSTPM